MSASYKGGSNTPRFFCESCGAEVPGNSKICPGCGRRFSSVLCPSCGFSGEESRFREGCPVCGYSRTSPPKKSGGLREFPESRKPAGALPFWIYILTAAAFTGILAALFFTLFK